MTEGMRPRAAATLLLLAALGPSVAGAQRTRAYSGAEAVQALDDAVERAWMRARDEAPQADFTAELQRLMREVGDLELRYARREAMERFASAYRRTRRALLLPGFTPSERLLDAWDELVSAWARVRRAVVVGGEPERFEIEGRLGAEPVRLTGRTLAELFEACLRAARRAERPPRRLAIGGRVLGPRAEPYEPAELCGIVALNAEPVGFEAPPLLEGTIEEVPFVLREPVEDARDALQRFLPPVLEPMTRIDDVRLGGRTLRAPRGGWSPGEVLRLIARRLELRARDDERLTRREEAPPGEPR